MDQNLKQLMAAAKVATPSSASPVATTIVSAASSRSYNLYYNHPARAVILDLFNLYLGRNNTNRFDDSVREQPIKLQKRIHAINRELPPPNEQFPLDFEQIRGQFPDQDQLQLITESVLISLVLECSNHAPRADFLLYAMRALYNIGYVNWDTLLPSLLSFVSSGETSSGQNSNAAHIGVLPSSAANPTSPKNSVNGIGSPSRSTIDSSFRHALSPARSIGNSESVQASNALSPYSFKVGGFNSLRQLCCKVILIGLESKLKPSTHAEIFNHMVNWLVHWNQRRHGGDEYDGVKTLRREKSLIQWLHRCLDVIWLLVEDDKCRVPFYELIRSELQFIDNIPDDEALFTLILEIHRRRDMMATHMLMLDQHLHCPTFGTHRYLSPIVPNIPVEAVINIRFSPITYPSVLGEPLHGEDLANSIQKGSLDWERALRCIRHALRVTPSSDWWKRVLLLAPCHRQNHPGPTPGAVFSSDMICEATIDRIVELLKLTNSEINCWVEWLVFSDIFYFLVKNGCIDFVDFVEKLVTRISEGDQQILRTNHVTWLLAQIIRVELVMSALNSDPRKVDITKKVLSFHREDRNADTNSSQGVLLDLISSCQILRIWTMNPSMREFINNEQLQKGKQIDEWWKQVNKADRAMDYTNMNERSVGMFWVVSNTMAQPACEAVVNWLSSAGVSELISGTNVSLNERITVVREVNPLPMSFLSGLSINLCYKLASQLENALFAGPSIPSIAMVETYCRLLLIAPHSLFRSHFNYLAQRYPTLLSKPSVTILVLEIVNYRLLPLYRYEGKSKSFLYDVTKVVATLKGKRGDHRVFRLAENLCLNLIWSQRDFFTVKREGKGPTDFTETLNRVTIISLAIISKTRGISDPDHLLYLQNILEQVTSASQHTWSERTSRHFPPLIREALAGRIDKKGVTIQAWQQAETTVINQCNKLLSPSADPSYVVTYINHSFPQHRQYLCAGAWILMQGHPENINSSNLARVLREFSPEEVTANIYTMVDVLLHNMQVELQLGHPIQDLLLKSTANLVFFVWTSELLPLDILLLSLIDRDDDPHALRIAATLLERQEFQQRVKLFCMNRGPPEHWLHSGSFKRNDLQKALGSHLSWKERYPVFFDDAVARLLPVIPLLLYRLIENEAIELADRVLALHSHLLAYHPTRFTFVRDILAYFYGHLPSKLIVRILNVLDLTKIPMSESFPHHVSSSNPVTPPPPEYFTSLLTGIVHHVIPPLSSTTRAPPRPDPQKPFYQIQDPGTHPQLVLETAVLELLSLPLSPGLIVSSLVQIIVSIQATLIQSTNPPAAPTSPSGDSAGGPAANSFAARTAYSSQQLSCLIIQACGLLLAQLPPDFHVHLYMEVSRVIKDSWWLAKAVELESAVGFALLDPTWAAQDNTCTAIGNAVALLHSFFGNLPHEWLEGTHAIVKNLRPLSSVAMLRIVFRIMGPLLPRLVGAHALFAKTLSLLLSAMVDVFGMNSNSSGAQAPDIADIVDFLHHVVHYEGQGGPVQPTTKPRPELLMLCAKAAENMHPRLRHLFSHLMPTMSSSIYAPPP